MANLKEIKNRIKSVNDTQKITNAMYMISSTKLRKAKGELAHVRPYFNFLQTEIKRIFSAESDIDSKYFYPVSEESDHRGQYGCLVVTSDKGLAGAYNQNVISNAMKLIEKRKDTKLYVCGEYGIRSFLSQKVRIEKSFINSGKEPTMQRARDITSILLDEYDSGGISKLFVIYTEVDGTLNFKVHCEELLPIHRVQFDDQNNRNDGEKKLFEFYPSAKEVLDNIVPGYIVGYIYGVLVESFCSEQNARMNAMDSANNNAQELLDELSVKYNHIRQSSITQEITEVSSSAKSMRKKEKVRR